MRHGALRCALLVCGVVLLTCGHLAPRAHAQSALSLTPATGAPGSVVSLSAPPGSLPGGSIAEVDFVDATGLYVGLPIGLIKINADGSITNFPITIVQQAAAGQARIFVTSAGISISAPFTVQPSITIAPAISQQKLPIAVNGRGFGTNATITFTTSTPNGTPQPAAPADGTLVVADALGNFAAMIVVPRGTGAGTLQVSASDGANVATATVQIMSPSALATPAAPAGGTNGVAPGTPTPAPPPAGPTTPSTTSAYFAEGYTGQAATNGRASFAETLSLLNPSSAAAQATITYIVQGGASTTITRTVAPATVLRESVNADVGPDKSVAAIVTSAQRLFVTRTIMRTAADGSRLDGSATQGVPAPSTTWGFPEGYTGFSFQEYLTLLNSSTTTAHVRVALAPQAASASGAQTLNLVVPPMSRITANIRALNATNTTKSVGMLLTSDQPVVAERVEYFGEGAGSGKFGSTVSSGIATPATAWRVAYGSLSGGDQQFITLLNPITGGAPVQVTATYAGAAGRPLASTTVAVAPGTRTTIVSGAVLHARSGATPFSVSLRASGPIDAEAAQYIGGSPNGGRHPGVAFPAVANASGDLFLSGLATQLPDNTRIASTIYLYNPGAAAAAAAATFFGAGGTPVHATYTVPAGGITAVPVSAAVGTQLPAGTLGAEITTSASGGLIVYAVGATADGHSLTEEVGVAPPG